MKRHIGSLDWVEKSAGRMGVRKLGGVMLAWIVVDDQGRVLTKGDYLARFDEHAEAITFAHREAAKAIAAKNQLPDSLKPCACSYEDVTGATDAVMRHERIPEPTCPQHHDENPMEPPC